MFSIIVCLFIITIDNNFSFSSLSDSRASSAVYNNNNIIVIKEARGFKENFLFRLAFYECSGLGEMILICEIKEKMARRRNEDVCKQKNILRLPC